MADGGDPLILKQTATVSEIPAALWDACAGDDNPFVSHGFLSALEDSQSVGDETGWLPRPITAWQGERMVAAIPAYAKLHSYGEYVFDHAWADAYRRAGGRYYPKLQVAVPFTPVPGPRLLMLPGVDEDMPRRLARGLVEIAERMAVSSIHMTFAPAATATALAPHGWLVRTGYQFHWENRGYRSFEDFLIDLASRKRKSIRKERREAQDSGLTILRLTGPAIEERHWDAFYRCYRSTSDRKWGQPYLTRAFFSHLSERMADRVLLVLAEDRGRPIAGALNLIGADALYGRNWGALEHRPFLHFECCYYQAIEFAIERGLARVEAGAQGEHKLARGYLPTETRSLHWLLDPGFRQAVASYLIKERAYVAAEQAALSDGSPFRQDPPSFG
ncbi:MAG: GNAT family N-acetyltransferase [Alphaproteobacteria bacterium]|nr:GNAT family N-acetyltransferase [Alphaproteobacteria bacterium]